MEQPRAERPDPPASPFTPMGYAVAGVILGMALTAILFEVGAINAGMLHVLAFAALMPVAGITLGVLVIGVPWAAVDWIRRRVRGS